MELIDEDFDWATTAVLAACSRVNLVTPPPVISILEGGYDLDAISRCAVLHCKVLLEGKGLAVSATGSDVAKSESSVERERQELINGNSTTQSITSISTTAEFHIWCMSISFYLLLSSSCVVLSGFGR